MLCLCCKGYGHFVFLMHAGGQEMVGSVPVLPVLQLMSCYPVKPSAWNPASHAGCSNFLRPHSL